MLNRRPIPAALSGGVRFPAEPPTAAPFRLPASAAPQKITAYDVLLAFHIAFTYCGYQLFIFIGVPLNIDEVNSRSITVPYRAALLGWGIWMLLLSWHKKRVAFLNRISHLLFVFWALYLFALARATLFAPEELMMERSYYWAYGVGICLLTNLTYLQRLTDGVLRLAPWLIWLFSLASNCLGLLVNRAELTITQRFSATALLNPITVGSTAVLLISLSAYFFFRLRKSWQRILILLSAVPGFITIAIAASRGPLIVLVISLCLVIYNARRIGKTKSMVPWLGAILAVIVMGLYYLYNSESALTERFASAYNDYRAGLDVDRFVLWSQAWDQFRGGWFMGNGFELPGIGYPHNLVIESFLVTGVVGGMVYLAVMAGCLLMAIKALSHRHGAWVGILMIQTFIGGMFSGGIYCYPEFWASVFLVASLATLGGFEGGKVIRWFRAARQPVRSYDEKRRAGGGDLLA